MKFFMALVVFFTILTTPMQAMSWQDVRNGLRYICCWPWVERNVTVDPGIDATDSEEAGESECIEEAAAKVAVAAKVAAIRDAARTGVPNNVV